MSKETAIKFLRELKTNEKAKDLLQGREKPKSKEDAIKAFAEVAKELGEDISPEDFAQALEEIEAEIHQKTEAVSADMQELKDDDVEGVAGGYWCEDGCARTYSMFSLCDEVDFCYFSISYYECYNDYWGRAG